MQTHLLTYRCEVYSKNYYSKKDELNQYLNNNIPISCPLLTSVVYCMWLLWYHFHTTLRCYTPHCITPHCITPPPPHIVTGFKCIHIRHQDNSHSSTSRLTPAEDLPVRTPPPPSEALEQLPPLRLGITPLHIKHGDNSHPSITPTPHLPHQASGGGVYFLIARVFDTFSLLHVFC